MINVRRETHTLPGGVTRTVDVPYISYFHASFAETKNSIRVAWLTPDADGNMTVRDGTYGIDGTHRSDGNYPSDSFTGAWEVMTIPTNNTPLSDEFVCNGVPTAGTLISPTASLNRPMSKSVLVGYLLGGTYEGAVLKKDIY
jgi:hypothetical protein